MNTKTVIIDIGCNDMPITPKSTNHRCSYGFTDEPIPTYTQAMADNGESPSVGMMVIDRRNKCEYEILLTADTSGHYVMKGGDGSYHCELLKYLKPIDTRTDKEKAFDEHFEKSGCDYKYQSILRNAFEAGISFQPLTVEVK